MLRWSCLLSNKEMLFMKIATITLHNTDNCGSTLQAYALQRFLIDNNYDNEIIDYRPSYMRYNGSILRTIVRRIVFFRDSRIRDVKFAEFKKKYLVLSEKVYTSNYDLCQSAPEAECYITGSDQLWNSMFACGKDPSFYLNFVNNKPKLAYAISMGRKVIPDDNAEIVKKYVQAFEWISVRENSSVSQLQKMLGRNDIMNVCDPVLLNSKEVYDSIKTVPLKLESYILVYVAQGVDKEDLEKILDRINVGHKKKVVFVGTYRSRCTCDIHYRALGPDEFIGLIANADYVISNSFHATVFSILYNKQFVTFLPNENGTRILEILNLFGLEKHGVYSGTELPQIIKKDEYEKINILVNDFRDKSKEVLLTTLKKIGK